MESCGWASWCSQALALPHLPPSKRCSSSNIRKRLSNKQKGKKKKRRKKKKRVSREEDHSVGKEGTESKGLVHKEGWEGIDKKRRVREVRKGKRKGKREKKRERESERVRVSTHIYPPPSDVRPRTSKVSVWGMFGFRGRGGGTTLSGW